MTGAAHPAALDLRADALAFRQNTVYSSDGDPIRLIANAERMEAGADVIDSLVAQRDGLLAITERALTIVRNERLWFGTAGGSCGACGAKWLGDDAKHNRDCLIVDMESAIARAAGGAS